MKGTTRLFPALATLILIICLAFVAAACGGGGGSGRVAAPPPAPVPAPEPAPEPAYISQNLPAPAWDVWGLGAVLHIGTSAGAPAEDLTSAGGRNGIRLYEGRIADDVKAADVIDYLREMVTDAGYLATFPNPPTVSVVEGTSEEFTAATLRAVRIVNSVLPYDKQVAFGESYAPAPRDARDVPKGNIHVEFLPQYRWSGTAAYQSPSTIGLAHSQFDDGGKKAHSSHILIDTGEDLADFTPVIVHELLHALGLHGHTDVERFPLSIMNPQTNALIPLLGTLLLMESDKDAVLAAYARFGPGTPASEITAENLGPWESTSLHLRGEFEVSGDTVAFGVSTRNAMAHPWATGPKPARNLIDNRLMGETATWEGALLGFTPSAQKISGDARLDVSLADLMGDLSFSGLEYDNNEPWGDGDLEYSVHIEKNTFHNWGHESKDEGDVTGAFFGQDHEGMAGVLRRRDLTGAFGGKR